MRRNTDILRKGTYAAALIESSIDSTEEPYGENHGREVAEGSVAILAESTTSEMLYVLSGVYNGLLLE
jgi:hypothetical protein